MAEELQNGICSGNWWSNARSVSACSSALTDMGNLGGWSSETGEVKGRSPSETTVGDDHTAASVSSSSVQDSGMVMMDTGVQFALSSTDWSHALLRGSGRPDNSLQAMLPEEDLLNSRSNFRQDPTPDSGHFQKEWCPKNFLVNEDSLKHMNQTFSFENRLNSGNSSGDCTVTGRSLTTSNYNPGSLPYASPSSLLQGLYEQEPLVGFQGNRLLNSPSSNYRMGVSQITTDEFGTSSWSKFPDFLKSSSPPKEQQQQQSNQLLFSNNTPFWNASPMANSIRPGLYAPSNQQFMSQTIEEKPLISNITAKTNIDEAHDSLADLKKSASEPSFKRPRLETPSPLPTFKVRKEKLGDRITALQQIVSPFGKTDTASVLYEAIQYIKFLHEQVNTLSTPYMKNGAPLQHHQSADKSKDTEGPKQDLRSRGLCLVPISSTYPVTSETAVDYWTPTFGGTYR
ncbi:transcription factor bHLH123 [Amborella trichopoda]|uniref:BHLH domain-containing protein n=1 Tax=Amborella trichopoda TaxID=13333 RepID=W1PXR5_AMBTC|nr:transcription factor bHLH123 [Amborella trichopoda]ERN12799.1 hypothetical protein AMTR_s00043p00225670 [Amborella trichopoda]|eukprot:XP_006851218.1 transcription factor bHLH123 [Amborella trichopoda]